MIRSMLVTSITLTLVSGCVEMGTTTEVNGFRHRVEQMNRNPPTYRAYGTSRKDRAMPSGAYFARNVIAIRKVSGCPIKPELISHDEAAAESVATVVC